MDYNDTYVGEFSYHNITRSQISIDKYNGQSNRVEIPEKISGQEVIEIGEGAFSDNLILEHVQMPDSVTAIKDNAYYGCRNLKIVHFGIGIKSIGDNAFAECESLQTIQIRSKLDYLGKNAFTLSGIETVEIAFIQNWQEESFALCSRLVSVSVKKATFIPDNCFMHDIYLETVQFEEQPEIAESAFKDCRRFSKLEIGEWSFSDSPNKVHLNQLVLKKRRPYFRVRIALKNQLGLESDVVMDKARKLYKYIAEHSGMDRQISSVIPDGVVTTIMNGKLPLFPHEDLGIAIDENELIHYVDHSILYKEVGNDQYLSTKGKVYLFSNKLGFYGGSDVFEVLIDDIAAVLEYDGTPKILEILTENANYYISVPNTEILFKALQNIENITDSSEVDYVETGTTIEEMIEGADLDSYIFYFEDVQHSQIDEEMQNQIGILIEKMHKLSAALEKYPDKVEGTHRFSSYYLPETLRLIFSYQQYLNAGVSKDKIDKVYDKVMESIETVIVAVEHKIDNIYQVATMDTVAKANALQKIMGQDGYTKGDGPLKH